jgi:DNA-binding transcriptional ArsR family regulator
LTSVSKFDISGNMKIKKAVDALSALAQESRLSVFRLLVKQGPSGLAAGTISAKLGIPAPTLSFHLSQLSRQGLVDSRRKSRSIIYAANYQKIEGLIKFLMENCCQGSRKELP